MEAFTNTEENHADAREVRGQVLCLRTQDARYAIDLRYVECILPLMELHPVPGGAIFLAGLLDYYGKSLATIDLGIWLGLNNPEHYHLDTPIVVCGDGEARLAIIANEIMQIETVTSDAVHMQDMFREGRALFAASLKLNTGIVLLLDMPRILEVNFLLSDSSFAQV
ncbi:MAG: chemotaxis protein CheW [Nitrosomonas sp.]|nr:MAG: chemotaxis protein CheW [Nitrosomonas sp.]